MLRGARVRRVLARIEQDPSGDEYGMPPGLLVFDLGPKGSRASGIKDQLGEPFLICPEVARDSICEETSRARVAGSVGM